jgi:hypothetical protein
MWKARIEAVLAAILAALAILTAIVPDWIEATFSIDPDGGDGTVEWLIVAVFALVALAVAARARRDFRILRTSNR